MTRASYFSHPDSKKPLPLLSLLSALLHLYPSWLVFCLSSPLHTAEGSRNKTGRDGVVVCVVIYKKREIRAQLMKLTFVMILLVNSKVINKCSVRELVECSRNLTLLEQLSVGEF